MEKEHRLNFLFLKKKVISTDMLIRRFKAKQDDILFLNHKISQADTQAKTVLTLKQQLDNANRDSNILSEQLKSAMESIKPLQEKREVLESALRERSSEVTHLTDRLHAEEALRNQRSSIAQINQELEREKLDMERKIKTLEAKSRSLQSTIKNLESDKRSLSMQKSINTKRLNKLALLLNSAQKTVNKIWKQLSQTGVKNGSDKPKVIPKSARFLIREALKALSEKKGTEHQENPSGEKDNVAGKDEDSEGSDISDIDNGYEEENEDSDFDNVSVMDLSDDAPETLQSHPSTLNQVSKNGQSSKIVERLKSSEESDKLKDLPRKSPRKSCTSSIASAKKTENSSPFSPKKASSNSFIKLNKTRLDFTNKSSISNNADSESEEEVTVGVSSRAHSKRSPTKNGISDKKAKQLGAQGGISDKNCDTPKSLLINEGKSNIKLKENDKLSENKTKIVGTVEKAIGSPSHSVRHNIKEDSSSGEESSFCSLHSGGEGLMSDPDPDIDEATRQPPLKQQEKEKLPLDTKNKEKSDIVSQTLDNACNSTPRTSFPPQPQPSSSSSSSSSLSSAESEDDEQGKEEIGRDLPSRQSSVGDAVVPDGSRDAEDAADGREAVTLDDVFSFMSTLSPLSPMPPTPCPRSRTQSEASVVEDGEAMLHKSESKTSEDNKKACSEPQDDHLSIPKIYSEGAEDNDRAKSSAGSDHMERETVEKDYGVTKEGNDSTNNTGKATTDLNEASGFPLSDLPRMPLENKQLKSDKCVESNETFVKAGSSLPGSASVDQGNGSNAGEEKGEPGGKKFTSPCRLRQLRMRQSLGFIPTDSIANEENPIPSSDNAGLSKGRAEVCSRGKVESYHDESPTSTRNSDHGCFTTCASASEICEDRGSNGAVMKKSEVKPRGRDSSNNPSLRSSMEDNVVSTREPGCMTRRRSQSMNLSSADEDEKPKKSSQLYDSHGDDKDANKLSAHGAEDPDPLIELYVIKSLSPLAKPGKPLSSSIQMNILTQDKLSSGTARVEGDKVLDAAGLNKKSATTPNKMMTRRSRRLSEALGADYVELSPLDTKGQRSLEQAKRSDKSQKEVLSDGVKVKGGESEDSASDNVREPENGPATPGKRRQTRSFSISENIEQTRTDEHRVEKMTPVRRSRRSVRNSVSLEELKPPQADSPTGQPRVDPLSDDKECGNTSLVQSPRLGLKSRRRISTQSIEVGLGLKPKVEVKISGTGVSSTKPVESGIIKYEPSSLSDDEGIPCVKFGPQISLVGNSLAHKLEAVSPSLESNSGDAAETKPLVLVQEEKSSQVNHGRSLKRDSVGKILTRSGNKRSSRKSGPEMVVSSGETDERGSSQDGPLKECDEGGDEKETKSGVATRRQRSTSNPLTRKTQMEIAAQQLAKMLMAAKSSSEKKKLAAASRVRTRASNAAKGCPASNGRGSCDVAEPVVQKTRSRGRPRKAALASGQSEGDDSAKIGPPTPNKGRLGQKHVIKQHGKADTKCVEDKVENNETESDLDTSSLSSDNEEVETKKTPKKNPNTLVKRKAKTKNKVAKPAVGSGADVTNNGNHKQKQENISTSSSSRHGRILPALSSSESEDEAAEPGSHGDGEQPQDKDAPAHSAHSPGLPALSSSDSEQETTTEAGAGKVTDVIRDEINISNQIRQKQATADACQIFHPEKYQRGRGRGKAKLHCGKPGESGQIKTASIRVDNGSTAKPIGDLRLRRKEPVSVNLSDGGGDEQLKKYQAKGGDTDRKRNSLEVIRGMNPAKKSGGISLSEPRVKSKEFISSSSEDEEEKTSGKEGLDINGQSTVESQGSLKQSQCVEPVGKRESTPKGIIGNIRQSCVPEKKSNSKRLGRVPHLLSSFVPSQFSAFKATKSPNDTSPVKARIVTGSDLDLDSDGEELSLEIVEERVPEEADSERLSGPVETAEDQDSSDAGNSSKSVIQCDNSSEPKEERSKCNSSTELTDFVQKGSKDNEIVNVSNCSPLGNQTASARAQGELDSKNGRKRKIELSKDQVTMQEESELCSLTLEYIFSLFRVTRCLSPLPPSPSPKKFRSEYEARGNSESLVKFCTTAPDSAFMITPAPTRLPSAKLDSEKKSTGSTIRNISGSKDGVQGHKNSGGEVGEGQVHTGSKGRHQFKDTATTSQSLSQQMIQARKLLKARKKPAETGKRSVVLTPPLKKRKEDTEPQTGAQRKKRLPANLGKFITPYAAILHDVKTFIDNGGEASDTVSAVLMRVDGREVGPVWAMVPHLVVECVDNQKDADILSEVYAACEETEGIIEAVFATTTELRLAEIISHLEAMDKSCDNAAIMGAMWNEIFRKDGKRSQFSVLSFCRLFTLLCMKKGDVEQARVLAYSIAWCGYLPLWPCLATIAGVWSLVLSYSASGKSQPIIDVLACILRGTYSDDSQTLNKIDQLTQRLCQWGAASKNKDAAQLLRILKDRLSELALNSTDPNALDKTFMIQKAMELLLIYKGVDWAEEHFHKRILVSVAMRWESRVGDDSGLQPAFVISIFRVFQSVLAVLTLTLSTAKHILNQVFARCLRKNHSHIEVDFVLLETLLELSAYDPLRSSEILRSWQNANPGKITPHLFGKIQETKTQLAQLLLVGDNGSQEKKAGRTKDGAAVDSDLLPAGNKAQRGGSRGGRSRGRGQKRGFRGRGRNQ
ncbi:hypothetical protein EGW08_013430 [Elysia chlorotica]|uniref:Uncharacterized protein n=1 Tax=Elysia chlorotica TaxID=188477 RepID=A0A433TB42_ELYCH|nr:hypothetical protein EGW08_013430 [Elysia chlorotica]